MSDHQPAEAVASGGLPLSTLARSILALLQADPSRYVSFGPYWPLVKRLLKVFYTRDNLVLLGPGVDVEAAGHMPNHATMAEAMSAAIDFYRDHQAYGLGSKVFEDPETGESYTLDDPDAAGL